MQSSVPSSRITIASRGPIRDDGDFVLYWMIASRRSSSNFALERAAEWARHLGRPLLVLEALRSDYQWASDRLHRFIIEGMADNRTSFSPTDVTYYPYVEPAQGAGRGLLSALSQHASIVITDDYPTFFLPKMVRSAAERLVGRLETVDSNGLLPMASVDRTPASRQPATGVSFWRRAWAPMRWPCP